MKSSASESVKNGYLNLERLSRSFRLDPPGPAWVSREFRINRRTFLIWAQIRIKFGSWKVRRLNWALVSQVRFDFMGCVSPVEKKVYREGGGSPTDVIRELTG